MGLTAQIVANASLCAAAFACAGPCAAFSLAMWAATSSARAWHGDRKLTADACMFGAALLWQFWSVLKDPLPSSVDFLQLSLLTLLLLIQATLLYRWMNSPAVEHASSTSPDGPMVAVREWTMHHPRSLIFPSRTTHTRFFPKKHAFSYSYLLCGYPIVPSGVAADGSSVSNGSDARKGTWWLQIRAEDHLERGNGRLGFFGKLQDYLRSQGLEKKDWSYAYLITAPRVFGYAFNPVSFWYIYDERHHLTHMVLEVNNTFGERRMYLLDGSSPVSCGPAQASDSPSKADCFTDVWTKDFHVSPFNSRKGSYQLRALNPFPTPGHAKPHIDNVITLKSSKDHAKILARVTSTDVPFEASSMGFAGTLRFVASWGWVGFVTFPRIVREAFKLYFRRSLHVWFRPEVLSSSVGRAPTSAERTLQSTFQHYVRHLVEQSAHPISVTYHTAISDRAAQTFSSPHAEADLNRLELRVTTPAFYSRFVHYRSSREAFDREGLFTHEKNRTLWISRPDLLGRLLTKPSAQTKVRTDVRPALSDTTRLFNITPLRWDLLRRLRCPPAAMSYDVAAHAPPPSAAKVNDIRPLLFSDLDIFAESYRDSAAVGAYRRTVTKIFLAQRFLLGFVEIADALDVLIRVFLVWMGVARLRAPSSDIAETPFDRTLAGGASTAALALSACHVYGLVKGYS